MEQVKKTITIPKDLAEWAEDVIKKGKYPGVRSLSGFIEYLIRNEMEKDKR
jgi:Arc/MetJ-type ribon-helix-helix transcriptional regulator